MFAVTTSDLFQSKLTAFAKAVIPATSSFEKDGTFVNRNGLSQSFRRAVNPGKEVRNELQIGFDLSGRKGLVTINAVRAELAKAMPQFAGLAAVKEPTRSAKLELATV